MTLTNEQRADRCAEAIERYSDDDDYTNLVDWLADAMHWCHQNDHVMADALQTALMHFDAELSETDRSLMQRAPTSDCERPVLLIEVDRGLIQAFSSTHESYVIIKDWDVEDAETSTRPCITIEAIERDPNPKWLKKYNRRLSRLVKKGGVA